MDGLNLPANILPFAAEYRHGISDNLGFIGSTASLSRLLGYDERELFGLGLLDLISAEWRSQLSAAVSMAVQKGGGIELLMPLKMKNGTILWVLNRGALTVADGGEPAVFGMLVAAESTGELISSLKDRLAQCEQKLMKTESMMSSFQIRAEQDSLTQVFNARTTRDLCEEYLSDPARKCAMIILDVDEFKQINDRYGHMVGDQVLTCAIGTVKKLFRSNDIVGRVGGDEFIVLMKDVSDRTIVELRCSQILSAFRGITCDALKNHPLTCSVGAAFSSGSSDYDDLFCRADKLLYMGKNSGGNCYHVEVN